jgi:CHAD domain-containing protein
MAVERALAVILETLVAVIEESDPGAVEPRNQDGLHDFRVAVRRTRSALALFGEVLPTPVLRHGRKLFKDLGRRTTDARDLDVLLLELPGYVEELGPAERLGLGELESRIGLEIEREYAPIRRFLAGKSYRREMQSWRAHLDRLARTTEGEPTRRCMATAIRKAAGRTEELAETLAADDPGAALHRLRIRFKKLRYALEFASPLTPGGEVDGVIALLKQLQDQLGSHQDLVVHERLIARFCFARDAPPNLLGRRLGEILAARRERLRDSIEAQATSFAVELASELDRALAALETF